MVTLAKRIMDLRDEARFHLEFGRREAAEELMTRASGLLAELPVDDPMREDIADGFATNYRLLGQLHESERYIRMALELGRPNTNTYATYQMFCASLLVELGRLDDAEQLVRAANSSLGEREFCDEMLAEIREARTRTKRSE